MDVININRFTVDAFRFFLKHNTPAHVLLNADYNLVVYAEAMQGFEKNLNASTVNLLRPFLARIFFQELFGLEGSKNSSGKKALAPCMSGSGIINHPLRDEPGLKKKVNHHSSEYSNPATHVRQGSWGKVCVTRCMCEYSREHSRVYVEQ